ncbi:ABC transporter permease subunit [Clostridium arbusti]|uniref:ABC transporter permease subunit n=1 Tax=Clostridium arbusti TaxID=1137848 RepID=UPI000288FD14|nr:ABC transporter permease subunit [Clostridium arbusti]
MNMYLHELKSLKKSTIMWICAMIALVIIYFSLYTSLAKDAADFKKLLGAYPASVRAMLGISLDNITSILGFYSMVFSFITLCGAIQAMNIGVSILSKESRERTADFLLVKPVSRAAIVSSKLLAALTMLLVTNVIYYAGASMVANIVKTSDYNNKLFFMISLTLLFIQLIFLAIGVFVSVFFTKLKSVLPISLGVVFGFYIIGALIATGKSDGARFISPFKYFDITYIIKNASYEVSYLIAGAVIVIAAIVASYIIYTKKDIHAVS